MRENPQLRFSEFKNEWDSVLLGEVYTKLSTGQTPSRKNSNYFVGQIPWITSGELRYNFIESTLENISDEAVKKTNLKIFPVGTLFIAITGLEAPGTRGKCAINSIESTTNQSCMAFLENEKVNNLFTFYWYIKHGSRLYLRYSQGTKQQSFNNSIVEKFKFSLPSIEEQNKIAEFLSSVDKKIQLLEKKKEQLELYKKGVMQKIFSREIRFKDDNGNSYPDWEEKKLGAIAKIYQPKTISQADLTNDGYVVYGANGIIGNYHSFNHELSQVVVTCRGSSCGTVNLTNPFSWITGNAMVINLDSSAYMNKKFLFFQLHNTDFNYLITGSGQPQITADIKSHKVAVPSFDEQKKIANFLSAIDSKIETTSTQINKTKEFKKGLLQQMFV